MNNTIQFLFDIFLSIFLVFIHYKFAFFLLEEKVVKFLDARDVIKKSPINYYYVLTYFVLLQFFDSYNFLFFIFPWFTLTYLRSCKIVLYHNFSDTFKPLHYIEIWGWNYYNNYIRKFSKMFKY